MNWDEKALTAGENRFIHGNENITTWTDQVQCELHTQAFTEGAKWQREQLHTDQAVEKVARAIFDTKYLTTWDKAGAWEKDNAFNAARAAITTLLNTNTP